MDRRYPAKTARFTRHSRANPSIEIGNHELARYLISFDDGTLIIPEEALPEAFEAAHKVLREAKQAGVWVFDGGVRNQRASIVATDGTVADGPYPETKAVGGGCAIVDVP